jgi:hypothetical protein
MSSRKDPAFRRAYFLAMRGRSLDLRYFDTQLEREEFAADVRDSFAGPSRGQFLPLLGAVLDIWPADEGPRGRRPYARVGEA